MNQSKAQDLVVKLRAHAASVDGTPEAAIYWAKANEVAAEHQMPVTDHPAPPAQVPPKPAEPRRPQPNPTTRRTHTVITSTTTAPTTKTTTAPKRPATRPVTADTLDEAFTERIRAAFGRTAEPGFEVAGRIVRIEEEPEHDFVTKSPKLNRDGTPLMVPVVILQTDGSNNDHGPGLRKLWMRSGVRTALIGACKDARTKHTAVGGHLAITYQGKGTPASPGFAAPNLFTATYTEPDQEA